MGSARGPLSVEVKGAAPATKCALSAAGYGLVKGPRGCAVNAHLTKTGGVSVSVRLRGRGTETIAPSRENGDGPSSGLVSSRFPSLNLLPLRKILT